MFSSFLFEIFFHQFSVVRLSSTVNSVLIGSYQTVYTFTLSRLQCYHPKIGLNVNNNDTCQLKEQVFASINEFIYINKQEKTTLKQ